MGKKVLKITTACIICGSFVTRYPCQTLKVTCCSRICSKKYLSEKMSNLNKVLNPTRMTNEVKEKVRNGHLGKGEQKGYAKLYGKNAHRIAAEIKLGRILLKGEIVHHEDENKRNNNPDNLIIFSSQSEHIKYHLAKNNNRLK